MEALNFAFWLCVAFTAGYTAKFITDWFSGTNNTTRTGARTNVRR